MTAQEQAMDTDRLRRALLAFQSAQVLILTHQRQNQPASQAELDAVRESTAEANAAFQTFEAAGLMIGADDQRLLTQARKYLADGAA